MMHLVFAAMFVTLHSTLVGSIISWIAENEESEIVPDTRFLRQLQSLLPLLPRSAEVESVHLVSVAVVTSVFPQPSTRTIVEDVAIAVELDAFVMQGAALVKLMITRCIKEH